MIENLTPWTQRRLKRMAALWGPLVAIAFLSVLAAVVIELRAHRSASLEESFRRAEDQGDALTAEQLAWKMLQKKPADVRSWLRFIDAHVDTIEAAAEDEDTAVVTAVNEHDIQKLLATVNDHRVAAMASLWYATQINGEQKPDPAEVIRLSESQPPVQFANYILGRIASKNDEWKVAAQRYEREGLAFPRDAKRSLRRALRIWIDHNEWKEVRARVRDPRYASIVDAALRYDLASHDRDWPGILLWCWPAGYVSVTAWPVVLALVAAALWFVLASRMGRIHDGVARRPLLYAGAFLLGVLSIYPTILTVHVEESVFSFRELHQFVPDLIYFVFGVGLREEAWKAILFLPLVATLLRRGSRIEAMTCGALVGLGFAAEENVSYFMEAPPSVALTRFLTANFLHMSLTALVALSVFDTLRKRATRGDGFNTVFPMAVGIHGAYDFLLSTREVPFASWMSLILLMIVSRTFLRQLLIASSKEEETGILNLLVASMALITGLSYVYATTIVGPFAAVRMIGFGILGVAMVIWMFVRELGTA